MRNTRLNSLAILLISILMLLGAASAQTADQEWEYLVVSYGTTYFSNPLLEADSADAVFSKIQLFSEIGVTLPQEAINLQRNIDVLGKFGWEIVAVVGSIGGDQQLVFKRPYDEQRSADEAQRIRAEREELIAAYNTSTADNADTDTTEPTKLVDLDAVERAQATEARNERDAATVRRIIETAAAAGFPLPELSTTGNAWGPDSSARVTAQITQDVTAAALVAPGQYRQSLAEGAVEQFKDALVSNGFEKPTISCGWGGAPQGEVNIRISAVIQHDGVATTVGSFSERYCFH